MYRLLKENSPFALGLAAALNFLLLIGLLIRAVFVPDPKITWLEYSLSLVLFFSISFLFTQLLSKHRLLPFRTYLPFSIFFLCSAPFLSHPEAWKFGLVGILLIYALDRCLSLAEISRINRSVLNASMAIGLASYFILGALASIVVVPIALLNFQHLSFRHSLMILTGIAIPWFLIWEFHFLFDLSTDYFFTLNILPSSFSLFELAGLFLLALLWIISIPHLFRSLNRTKLKTRQSVLLVVWASLFSCTDSLLISGLSIVQVVLLGPALIMFISYRLIESKKTWHADLILLLCMFIAVYNLFFLN